MKASIDRDWSRAITSEVRQLALCYYDHGLSTSREKHLFGKSCGADSDRKGKKVNSMLGR